ncbi:hypothetical protein [Nonomuraea maritima]|uniref:hypothetical protein n=1 Tax=Nonomuraea maritima TaxID=683260 RepID=UPI00372356EE
MAAPRLISCVLAMASLATVGACSSAAPSPTEGEPRATGVAGGGVGTSTGAGTPGPSALTPEAYRSELERRHDAMAGAITAMARARRLKDLTRRVVAAEEKLNEAAQALAALVPPEEVRARHDAYVSALSDLAHVLGTTMTKVGVRELCTSSAVLADVGGRLAALDAAGRALRSAGDYPADVVSVKAGKKQTRRLRNGEFVRKGTLGGRGSLEIDNGGDRDAVVTAVKGGRTAFSVYVRRKATFKVRGVRDGSYRVYFSHGVDWEGRNRRFTRKCGFEKFAKPVEFETTYTATQILWHDWRITLHSITGGNVRTEKVDPDDFPS